MVRGFIVTSACYPYPIVKISTSTSIKHLSSLFPVTKPKTSLLRRFQCSSPFQVLCISSSSCTKTPVILSRHKEAFAKQMAMSGLKPCHRLALGVSGGPDSMALCVLAAQWKANLSGCTGVGDEKTGVIDGLLAIIVDHGLRPESKEEAEMVSRRVSGLGIKCEIAHADWSSGRPKQGHIQEAARDIRYQFFDKVCRQHEIGVLLVAHHADDQAELFVLRLSRNSGVLGLAGMALTSQLFPSTPIYQSASSHNQGILLVRPLLGFSKEDLYEICINDNQKWVEDPTNKSHLFARNRIRMALGDKASCTFKSELQMLISNCRETRTHVDHICRNMIDEAVRIVDHGYILVDLMTLDPSNREDIFLSKFLTLVLQFISQRHRPVRGGALRLLLDYVRTFPCKTSLTAAGCYLCPAPGTKGTIVTVCCCVQSVLPSHTNMFSIYSNDESCHKFPAEVDEIITEGKSHILHRISNTSSVKFLKATSSDELLDEAKRLNIISEMACQSIIEMKTFETERFRSNSVTTTSSNESSLEEGSASVSDGEAFQPGQCCYFMNRFLITWKKQGKGSDLRNDVDLKDDYPQKEELMGNQRSQCNVCVAGDDMSAKVRHMVDDDWLALARLSKFVDNVECRGQKNHVDSLDNTTRMEKLSSCSDYAKSSAQQSLKALKSIPAAARRGLPVLVSPQGLLLSIPSIGFRSCPCLIVSAEFKPRVPLGGGHTSFL